MENSYPEGVSTNALAEEMETKASSVTDDQEAFRKKMLDYKKYQGVKLSKTGREAAIAIVRKHRLWEVFLVEKLNFNWDEVHDVAEQLEHIRSALKKAGLKQMKEFQLRPAISRGRAYGGSFRLLDGAYFLPYALSFAAGAMIFVVVEEVIPESQQANFTDIATLGFIAGFIIMMTLDVGLG